MQLAIDDVDSPEPDGYGVDHVEVAEGLGCKAIRVREPDARVPAFEEALAMVAEFRVPVILEKATDIAMGTELDAVKEFGELADTPEHLARPALCAGGGVGQAIRS